MCRENGEQGDKGHSRVFDSVWSDWAELEQLEPTRRHRHGDLVHNFSRLDRIYTTLPLAVLSDSTVVTCYGTCWFSLGYLGQYSCDFHDHGVRP